jgi:hypothetical protein
LRKSLKDERLALAALPMQTESRPKDMASIGAAFEGKPETFRTGTAASAFAEGESA